MNLVRAKGALGSPTFIAHLLLLGVVLIWGTTFALVKAALRDTTPLLFNLLRMTIAFAAMAAVSWPAFKRVRGRDLKYGAAAGLFLGLGYQLQTSGLDRTSASKAAFITGLVVVLVPLLAAIPGVRAEGSSRPGIDIFAGAVLAFLGLMLLTLPPGAHSGRFSGFGLGEWLCLGCAIAFAAHLLVLSRAAHHLTARTLGTLQIGFAALLMLITLPIGGKPHLQSSPTLWIALAVTSLLATAAAFTIQSWSQKHLPPSHVALIFTLEPVFAWLTATMFFGEQLGHRALVGAGCILLGILLAELRPTSRYKRQLIPITGA